MVPREKVKGLIAQWRERAQKWRKGSNVRTHLDQCAAELEALSRSEEGGTCITCGGVPPVSGLQCICGGSGRIEDEVQGLRARVFDLESARPAPQGWQPIETAPKGERLLLWSQGWDECELFTFDGVEDWTNGNAPTHWMKPDPPAVSGVTRGEI